MTLTPALGVIPADLSWRPVADMLTQLTLWKRSALGFSEKQKQKQKLPFYYSREQKELVFVVPALELALNMCMVTGLPFSGQMKSYIFVALVHFILFFLVSDQGQIYDWFAEGQNSALITLVQEWLSLVKSFGNVF